MRYEVVITGRGGTPAKNKTEARKIVAELRRQYVEDGWTVNGSAQSGGFTAAEKGSDTSTIGCIVRSADGGRGL